eukprot:gene19979-26690_t
MRRAPSEVVLNKNVNWLNHPAAWAWAEDMGKYDRLTFWEQVDGGRYATRNRLLLTAMPVITYMAATNMADFKRQPLGLNLVVVVVCVIAKLPQLHKVRILGINKY